MGHERIILNIYIYIYITITNQLTAFLLQFNSKKDLPNDRDSWSEICRIFFVKLNYDKGCIYLVSNCNICITIGGINNVK